MQKKGWFAVLKTSLKVTGRTTSFYRSRYHLYQQSKKFSWSDEHGRVHTAIDI